MTAMTSEQEFMKGALTDGLTAYFEAADVFHHYARDRAEVEEAMARASQHANDEATRVANLLRRDIEYREKEAQRSTSVIEIAGQEIEVADVHVEPTPEWLERNAGQVMTVAARPDHWQERAAETVKRRYEVDQLRSLHGRGVLDDDQFKACLWYRDRREAAQMDPSPRAMQYGETVRGDPVYGHLPTTEWSAEARNDFRWATSFIPSQLLPVFQSVVIANRSFDDTAKIVRRRNRYVKASFLQAAHLLCGGIQHRLMFNFCS